MEREIKVGTVLVNDRFEDTVTGIYVRFNYVSGDWNTYFEFEKDKAKFIPLWEVISWFDCGMRIKDV